jgi:CheY-like chemotaxis protein
LEEDQRSGQHGDEGLRNLRVLLVEDDPLIRMSTEDQLIDCGCQVVAVRDGEQALLALGRASFDVLFSDQRLPAMSGLELIGQARRQWPGLGVVLASGYGDLSGTLPADARLVSLPKPYTQDGIRRALARAMQGSEG